MTIYRRTPMQYIFSQEADITQLQSDITTLSAHPEVESIIVYICDENKFNDSLSELETCVKRSTVPLIGGIFPEIVYEQYNYQTGYLLVGINMMLTTYVVPRLSDETANYEDLLEHTITEDTEFHTMMVFVDGLAGRINSLVQGLYATFGSEVNYIGGGAGSLSFVQHYCLCTEHGVYKDSAVIATLTEKLPTAVGHGWESFSPNHQITLAEKNIVKEIDYKNALEVYENIINVPETITTDNFFTIAQSFPLGIKRIDGEYIVRDPISITPEGWLVCVGEVASGEFVDILNGNKENLITSSQNISSSLADKLTTPPQAMMVFDCISRALFMHEHFSDELKAMTSGFTDAPTMFGCLVLGEISNSGAGYLEFYNKTSVIAAL